MDDDLLTGIGLPPSADKPKRVRDPKKNYANVRAWRERNKDKRAEQSKRYRANHPDKMRATSDRYLEKHRERLRPVWAERASARRAADPVGQKRRELKYKAKRAAELERQAGRPKPLFCEVCSELNRHIVYDHDHNTGLFRGWLCDRCNKVLGLVYDNEELLHLLAHYLEAHDGEANG